MQITVFESLHAATGQVVTGEWSDFRNHHLQTPVERTAKELCPLLNISTYGDKLTPLGMQRNKDNVVAIWGAEGDHDAGTMTPAAAAALLQAAGIEAFVHTTAKHTALAPRWRVLAPASQAYVPAVRRELVGRLNAVLGGCLAGESFKLGQGFFFGHVIGTAPYECYTITGTMIDLHSHIVPVIPPERPERQRDVEWRDGPVPEWNGPTDDEELIRRALAAVPRMDPAAVFGDGKGKPKASFADLWYADEPALVAAFPGNKGSYNASDVDAALAARLNYWDGNDFARTERIMRSNKKLAREKWDRQHGYLQDTIVKFEADEVLQDPKAPAPSVVQDSPRGSVRREGQDFIGAQDQDKYFSGCVYVRSINKMLVPGGELLGSDAFNEKYGGFLFGIDNANQKTTDEAWKARTRSRVFKHESVKGTTYRPDLPPAAIVDDRVNVYWPSEILRIKGDPNPYLDLIKRMYPIGRDAEIVLAYSCFCVQYPGVKSSWWPVLQGAQGNGKTMLGDILAEAVGWDHSHKMDASDLGSTFNSWAGRTRFVAIEEMRSVMHQHDVMEKLKMMVAGGKGLMVQPKGVDQQKVSVCFNGWITTNHKDSIRKTPDGLRRFCILYGAQQVEADLVRDGLTEDYFFRLGQWLAGDGQAIVNELLHTHAIPDDLNPAKACRRAPKTSSDAELSTHSLGKVEQEVAEAIDLGKPGFAGGWLSMMALKQLLGDRNKLSPSKCKEVAANLKYIPHPGLPSPGRTNHAVQPDGTKTYLWVLPNSPQALITGAAEIAKAYENAQAAAAAAGVVFRT